MLKSLLIAFLIPLDFSAPGNMLFHSDSLAYDNLNPQHTPFLKRLYRNVHRYFSESNQIKKEKKFDFSVIGGPHYSSDTKLGIGIVASGLYRTDRTNLSGPPSYISIYGDVATTGFYLLGVRSLTIFKENKYRLEISSYFFSLPGNYWGIGYAAGNNKEQHTTYKRQEKQIRLDFSRRILPDTYIGGISLFCHVNGKHFKDITFLKGEKNNITVQGFGLFVSYDSRDFQPNPLEGTYIKLEQLFFPDFWDNPFKRTEFNFRQYNKIWQGAILASDLQGTFNYGNPPWSMVALIGGSNRMRGYYEGQYRDSKSIQAQIEIRQHIYNRHGMVLWGGAGNVFPDFRHFRWKEMLPTYGIGYRWEFKKRVNIRLDYGFGKGQNAFYFNIDEAF